MNLTQLFHLTILYVLFEEEKFSRKHQINSEEFPLDIERTTRSINQLENHGYIESVEWGEYKINTEVVPDIVIKTPEKVINLLKHVHRFDGNHQKIFRTAQAQVQTESEKELNWIEEKKQKRHKTEERIQELQKQIKQLKERKKRIEEELNQVEEDKEELKKFLSHRNIEKEEALYLLKEDD